jgi:hypothetical protein
VAKWKQEFEKMLDFMYQQLELLEVLNILPDDLEQSHILVNRALDVRSACMMYLAVGIRHNGAPLGNLGTIFWNISVHYDRESIQNTLSRRPDNRLDDLFENACGLL